MPPLLALLLPLGLAAAVSPMMLSEQVVLLGTRRGLAAAAAYAAGTVTVTLALVAAVVLLGARLELPTTPHLDAALDLLLGGALLVVALALLLWRRRRRVAPRRPRTHDVSPASAYAFGLVAMATNVTSLALLLPAAKEIAASDVTGGWKGIAVLLLVALACLPAWAPVGAAAVAPRATAEVLGVTQRAIDRFGPTVVLVALTVLGLFLMGRGVYRLDWLPALG